MCYSHGVVQDGESDTLGPATPLRLSECSYRVLQLRHNSFLQSVYPGTSFPIAEFDNNNIVDEILIINLKSK